METTALDLAAVTSGRVWVRTGALERLRVTLGLSRWEMARRLGTVCTTYTRWVDEPSWPRAANAAAIFGLVEELFPLVRDDEVRAAIIGEQSDQVARV